MNTLVAQPQNAQEAPHGTQMPKNAWYAGFNACMHGEAFEAAKARGGMYLKGWWAGLSAEAEMNTPVMENA